ncbi:MAG: sigma-70 family RNA polymerase sigma factor [Verrucomicrobiota bacterium]
MKKTGTRKTKRASAIGIAQSPTETTGTGDQRANNDAFTLYLREIGQTPLITPAEEIALAALIKKGDKAAREKMIKANLRLVVKIARDYENYGLPLLDLISEGNIGLMKAVGRFDPNKGAKLSTYAAWWIKQGIRRAISDQSKTIRLPVHVGDKLLHIRRAEAKFENEFGRPPTDDELSSDLGMSAKRIAQYRKASISPTSLDATIGDTDSTIAEVVADENAGTPYEHLEEKTDTWLIREVLPMLDPREREILQSRFGLDGDREKTLEEIGNKLGVTRERIRQIQEMALAKLRVKIEELETMSIAA